MASEVVGSSPIAHPRNDKGFSVDSLKPFFMFETYFFFRVFNYLPVRGRDAVPWESVPVEVVPVPVILLFFPPAANAATVLVAKTKVRTIKTSLFITTLLCIDNFLFFLCTESTLTVHGHFIIHGV